MAGKQALRQIEWVLGVAVLATGLLVLAQQEARSQGSQNQHPSSPPSTLQSSPSLPEQKLLPLGRQLHPKGHPQVKEMPSMQSPIIIVPQSEPGTTQPSISAPQSGASATQPVPAPPVTPTIPPLAAHSAKPAYFGIIGESAPGCRCPAGIRVTHVVRNSPAHRAGLKGEQSLTWTQATETTLAISPTAPLGSQNIVIGDHQSWSGDLILAIDGKRIHKKEELIRELNQCRPGDIIYLSVIRGSDLRPFRVAVTLTEYPMPPPATQTADAPQLPLSPLP